MPRKKPLDKKDVEARARARIAAATKRAKTVVVKKPKHHEYSLEMAHVICQELAKGKALYKLCEEHEDWPSELTVYRWARDIPEFQAMFEEARIISIERRVEEIINIADTDDNAAKARNRIDARKWLASKLIAKKYGDKNTTEITGPQGGPVQVQRVIDVTTMTPEDLEALGRLLENAAQNGLEENG